MNIGIIGTGGRSLAYLEILKRTDQHRIAAICDNDADRLESYRLAHLPALDPRNAYTDYRGLLSDSSIGLVILCTPDTTHREIAMAAASAGKAILLEKPVATNLEDTLTLLDGLEGYPHAIYLGFVLRYTAFYQKIHEIVRSGALGNIVTLQAREMLDTRHASSFYRRWHRFSVNNGGLMNAKCSHDLDLLNWIVGSDPEDVFALGGNKVFVPKEGAADHCRDCGIRADCLYAFNTGYYQENFGSFHSLSDLCVYNSEKDIVDHECMLIRYADGTVAQFELCLFGHEENRTITIHGTKAVLEGDFLRGRLTISPLKGTPETVSVDGSAGGHGGGDQSLMADLFEAIVSGRNVNHIKAGCMATLAALAGEESMRSGRSVKISALRAEFSRSGPIEENSSEGDAR
ncbi:MAG: Gfo/Idh/MocA family protein [Saccharofermentanales bacterium]